MGKVIASYLVKVTLREPDGLKDDGTVAPAPTNERLADAIRGAIEDGAVDHGYRVETSVTSERTDR